GEVGEGSGVAGAGAAAPAIQHTPSRTTTPTPRTPRGMAPILPSWPVRERGGFLPPPGWARARLHQRPDDHDQHDHREHRGPQPALRPIVGEHAHGSLRLLLITAWRASDRAPVISRSEEHT